MQVVCPNCGARYAVDPLAIGPVGRIVQCARCANRWLQTVAAAKADAAARKAADAPAVVAPETPSETPPSPLPEVAPGVSPAQATASIADPVPASPPSPSLSADPSARPSFDTSSFNSSAIPNIGVARAPDEPFESVPDLVIRPPRERTSLPAVIARRPSRGPMLALTAIGALIVLFCAGVAIFVFREPILAHLPPDLRSMLNL